MIQHQNYSYYSCTSQWQKYAYTEIRAIATYLIFLQAILQGDMEGVPKSGDQQPHFFCKALNFS